MGQAQHFEVYAGYQPATFARAIPGPNCVKGYNVTRAYGYRLAMTYVLDATPWVRFWLSAHFNQATTLLRRTRERSDSGPNWRK